MGRLQALADAGVIAVKQDRVRASSIGALILRIAERAVPCDRAGLLDVVPLTEVLRRYVPLSMTRKFVDALLHGKISVISACGVDADLKRLLVVRSQFHDHMNDARTRMVESDRLSIPAAAELIGVKQEVMYHLVNAGLVRTVIDHTGRRTARAIERSYLARFNEEIEPLVRVAFRSGVSARKAFRWAQSQGLCLVLGPSVDGGRQYFVRKPALRRT